MKHISTIFIFLLMINIVSAEEGFILRWDYRIEKEVTSIAPIDFDSDRKLDDVIAGSLDNRIYAINSNGSLLGYYETESSIYAVSAFDATSDGKLNCGVAGSWTDLVYAFWQPMGSYTLPSASHLWNYDTGDNVYTIATIDLNGNGNKDSVVVGTGNFADVSYGRVYALDSSGGLMWTYDTSAPVNAISEVDLDSDGLLDNVIVGAGKNVFVLNANGSLIWSYSTNDIVNSVSYADFNGDGEFDDVIVGSGKTLSAIDSHKNLLWTYEADDTITTISAIDFNGDDVVDYYLIAYGSKLFAFENSKSEGNVLWSYDTKKDIGSHISIDFDSDGISDDIVIRAGNKIYAYDYAILSLPSLKISKSVSNLDLMEGESITVTITLKNTRRGNASKIYFSDAIPEGLELVAGDTGWSRGSLKLGEEKSIIYVIKALEAGTYQLPQVDVNYLDDYDTWHVSSSNNVTINVASATAPPILESPLLNVLRTITKPNLTEGENATVDIIIKNLGGSKAINISLNDSIPKGLELIEGKMEWEGELEPGKTAVVSYTIKAQKLVNFKNVTYQLPELKVSYGDPLETYHAISPSIAITVEAAKVDWRKRVILVVSSLTIVGVLFALYKKKKIKEAKTLEELGTVFIKTYVEYQKGDKRPTYGDMKKRLGIGIDDVEKVVEFVKQGLRK